jgi:ferredoxin
MSIQPEEIVNMNHVLKWLREERLLEGTPKSNRRADSPAVPQRPFLGKAPILDVERCTGCGACVDVCGFGAVELDGRPSFDSTRCEACGACIAMCREDALRWPLGQR